MNVVFITPHFAPDVAPTGELATRIVDELVALGHRIEVFTSLPWYREHRVEPAYAGETIRREDTPWGSITRIDPFATSDKRNIFRRGLSFTGFTAVLGYVARKGPPIDIVIAMSPPLTLGLAGWRVARRRGGAFVFNVQDIFPDVAVDLGVLTNPRLIATARRLERFVYEKADAVTVLSDDLRSNVTAKLNSASKVHVIPNFVDTDRIVPAPKENAYREEFGLTGKTVVMYAGNVGLSQSLEIVLDSASALAHEEDVVFVVNGQGAALADLERRAAGLKNVRFVGMQPLDRLPEVLAAADVHLVPLRKGLARSSVPSKTYSILASGRPLVASVDQGSEVARIVENARAGIAVPPDDAEALTKALRTMLDRPDEREAMGEAGRKWVEGWASPEAVAHAYDELFRTLR